jgi:phage terminase large subunit GpA-like protein
LSRIELEYEQSDRRRWWVPCPECGEYQVLEEKRLQWPKKTGRRKPLIFCVHCNAAVPSHRKAWMNARGQWRAEQHLAPEKRRVFIFPV